MVVCRFKPPSDGLTKSAAWTLYPAAPALDRKSQEDLSPGSYVIRTLEPTQSSRLWSRICLSTSSGGLPKKAEVLGGQTVVLRSARYSRKFNTRLTSLYRTTL